MNILRRCPHCKKPVVICKDDWGIKIREREEGDDG